ncbi:MAG: TauD/TfdA family dioxygenase [Pseudomonadota bacterium]
MANEIFSVYEGLTLSEDPRTGALTATLKSSVREHLRSQFASMRVDEFSGNHEYVRTLRQVAHSVLPASMLKVLDEIRTGVRKPTCLVIDNLPSDDVVAAPGADEVPAAMKPTTVNENTITVVGALLGEPYSIAEEGSDLVNNLIPSLEDRLKLTGNGSKRALTWHIENGRHRVMFGDRDLSPSGVLLSGVVAPKMNGPKTLVANGRLAAARLTDHHYRTLRDVPVDLAVPVRHRGDASKQALKAHVLSGPEGLETVTAAFYGTMMSASTAELAEALEAFRVELDKLKIEIEVTPGRLVYVPNTYSLHARGAFEPKFDQNGRANRWLQRVFTTTRLDMFEAFYSPAERIYSVLQDENEGD